MKNKTLFEILNELPDASRNSSLKAYLQHNSVVKDFKAQINKIKEESTDDIYDRINLVIALNEIVRELSVEILVDFKDYIKE